MAGEEGLTPTDVTQTALARPLSPPLTAVPLTTTGHQRGRVGPTFFLTVASGQKSFQTCS